MKRSKDSIVIIGIASAFVFLFLLVGSCTANYSLGINFPQRARNSDGGSSVQILGSAAASTTTAPLPVGGINLSNNSAAMSGVDVASSGNNVYAVWSDDKSGHYQVYFASSYNDGVVWNPVQQLTDYVGSSAQSNQPRVAASGSYVYVDWVNGTDSYPCAGCGNQLLLRSSSNNGQTFGSIVTISNEQYQGQGDLVASGNNVYAAWGICTGCPSNIEIFFSSSTNNGATFSTQIQLSNTPYFSTNAKIAVSGNYVYVDWDDNGNGAAAEILYAVSSNNGASFGAQQSLSNDTSHNFSDTSIAASGSNVYAVYMQTSGFNGLPCPCTMLFKVSNNNGTSFGSPSNLTTLSVSSICCLPDYPSILISGNTTLIVWDDLTSSNYIQVLWMESTDGGSTWQATHNLSNDSAFAGYPLADLSSNSVYVVWEDNSTGHLNAFFTSIPIASQSSSSRVTTTVYATTTSTLVSDITTTETTTVTAPATATTVTVTVTSNNPNPPISGIPEFPFEPVIAAIFTIFVVAAYLMIRRRSISNW